MSEKSKCPHNPKCVPGYCWADKPAPPVSQAQGSEAPPVGYICPACKWTHSGDCLTCAWRVADIRKAEIERLKAEVEDSKTWVQRIRDQLDDAKDIEQHPVVVALRKEREEVAALYREVDAERNSLKSDARKYREALAASRNDTLADCIEERDRIRADLTRLTEALEKIKDGGVPNGVVANVQERMLAMVRVASEALAAVKEKRG